MEQNYYLEINIHSPTTVAARSKAWIISARSNTGIVGSNLTRGMNVCVGLFCIGCSVCS
jgi:hypothetical protein